MTKVLTLTLAVSFAVPLPLIAAPGHLTLQVKNDIPQFERFYRDASRPGTSEALRWALWKKEYGIAAVPPTPAGEALARKQLDAVWPRYKALFPRLEQMRAGAAAEANLAALRITRELLPANRSATIAVVLYVGQFDDNAFSIPAMNGRPPETLMPIESRNMQLLLAHELSHDVNFALAHVQHTFGAPLGQTIFLEGLAMRSASRAFPGYSDAAFTEMPDDRGWLRQCLLEKNAVLLGARKHLSESGPAVTTRFTFGTGTTGMHREAYCAAWIVFGALLRHGVALSQLAAIPEDRMVDVVRQGIDESVQLDK
ncbi:MAG: hypothetical protein JO322_00410 [Candidatus Eremiobacteraeota bacterium]|nr:hypothetical protein [Candidatus Eremiobacteraeota bacterium]